MTDVKEPKVQKSKFTVSCKIDVAEALKSNGFCHMPANSWAAPPKLSRSLATLIGEFSDLPVDPYVKAGERHRRYGRFVYLPWSNSLSPRSVAVYQQDGSVNVEAGGVARQFPPLTDEMLANKLLNNLIRLDFALLPLTPDENSLPWDVGVHIIQMRARPGYPGISSPDCLHKDGEPFTYIHLLERKDVTGGVNVIADNLKVPIFQVTLTDAMDSLVVKDDTVYHHVQRVEVAPGLDQGYRTVLLIDFTPMKAQPNRYPPAA